MSKIFRTASLGIVGATLALTPAFASIKAPVSRGCAPPCTDHGIDPNGGCVCPASYEDAQKLNFKKIELELKNKKITLPDIIPS